MPQLNSLRLIDGRHQAIIWINAGIVNSTLRNKLQWNISQNLHILIQENALENVICEMKFVWASMCLGGIHILDSTVHGANMGHTWVLSAPDGPRVCPMNLAISDAMMLKCFSKETQHLLAQIYFAIDCWGRCPDNFYGVILAWLCLISLKDYIVHFTWTQQ